MTRPFFAVSCTVTVLLVFVHSVAIAQDAPRRLELRALAGAAIPVGPDGFRGRWNPGPGGALGAGYALAAGTEVGVEVEYARYPQVPFEPPVASVPDGQASISRPPTALWAAWFDGSHEFLDGGVRPKLHAGVGVVSFGAARTGLGLRIGAGLDVPVASHLGLIFDATFAHAFTQAEGYALSTPFSYSPLRAGVSWR